MAKADRRLGPQRWAAARLRQTAHQDVEHVKKVPKSMRAEFRNFLDTFVAASTFPNSEHLPSFWESAERELDALPREHRWTVDVEREVLAEWVRDARSLNAWYWGDLARRADAVLFLIGTKLRELLTSAEVALLGGDLFVSALLLRAVMEQTASLYAFSELLRTHLDGLQFAELESEVLTNQPLEQGLIQFSHGSRFNWSAFLAGDADAWAAAPEAVRDEHKQTNVLTLIDKVAKNPRYDAFRAVYALLCEYVHPNLGGHLLYLRKEELDAESFKMQFDTNTTSRDVIRFLEPLTGVLLSCLEIVAVRLPAVRTFLAPLNDWCKEEVGRYNGSREARD